MMNNTKIFERPDSTIVCEAINKPNDNVHIYEKLPRTGITYVRNRKDELVSVQTSTTKKFTYKVIYNGLTTIVIFDDGSKGIAKCKPSDKFKIQTGHDIAWNRARINQLENEIKELSK